MNKSTARALSLVGFVCCLLFLSVPVQATSWGDVTVTSGELPGDPDLRELGSCSMYESALSYLTEVSAETSPLTTYHVEPETIESYGSVETKCTVRSDSGYFWNNRWAPETPDKSVKIVNIGGSIWAAPGRGDYLHMQPFPRYYQERTVSLNYGFGPGLSGKMGVRPVGDLLLKTFEFDQSSINDPLRYNNGSLIAVNPHGAWFSKNGRFAAINVRQRGFVVIDLQERIITPFAAINARNFNPLSISISNDGLLVSLDTSVPTIYNLASCPSFSVNDIPLDLFGSLPASCSRVFDSTTQLHSDLSIFTSSLGSWLNPAGNKLVHDRRSADGSQFRRYEFYPSELAAEDGSFSGVEGYLALGDSFASGEGDRQSSVWYEPGTDVSGQRENLCHISRRSYSYLLAKSIGYMSGDSLTPDPDGLFHSVACSGAKIHNIIGGPLGEIHGDGVDRETLKFTDNQYRFNPTSLFSSWQPGVSKQTNFLTDSLLFDDSKRPLVSPEAITIGIGGNDAGFSDFIKACFLGDTCEYAQTGSAKMTQLIGQIASLKPRLVETYRQTKQLSPETRVYAIGYPIFASETESTCGLNVQLNAQERKFIRRSVLYTNEVIEAAAQEAGVAYVNIAGSLAGHMLCSDVKSEDLAVNGLTYGNDDNLKGICVGSCLGNESFHPNELGHELIFNTINNQTDGLTTRASETVHQDTPLPDATFFGIDAYNLVAGINNGQPYELSVPASFKNIEGTNIFEVKLTGLMPGSKVDVYVESTPTLLGSFVASSTGELKVQVDLPAGLEKGYHELHVHATKLSNQKVDYYQSFVLGVSDEDFDSDGILDPQDSCPTVTNSGMDVDGDGVDDVCDILAVAPVLADEPKIGSNESISQARIITKSTSGATVPQQTTVVLQASITQNQLGLQNAEPGLTAKAEPSNQPQNSTTKVLGSTTNIEPSIPKNSATLPGEQTTSSYWAYFIAGLVVVISSLSWGIIKTRKG